LKVRNLIYLAAVALIPAFGHADTFYYSGTGPNSNVHAVITATPTGSPNQFDITAISGYVTMNGVQSTISGLVPNATFTPQTSPSGAFIFDNILFTSGPPFFDTNGIDFYLASGGEVNFFPNTAGVGFDQFYFGLSAGNYPFTDTFTAEQLSTVPEPGSLVLVATGMWGSISLLRRRRAL